MSIELAVIGVPSSAGAHHAGQDRTPAALRERGFISRLASRGVRVVDAGDMAAEVWTPDAADAVVRNMDAAIRVALAIADAVERESSSGRIPVVVGGDCTITLGVIAGLQRVQDDVRLAYVDGDADLSSPERTRSGILDASGVAHLLGIADTPLARIRSRFPMLDAHQLTLLGYDPTDHDSFDEQALQRPPALVHASDAQVRADPAGAAHRAVDAIAKDGAAIVVHFDVDAVDSRDLALANFPHYGTGIPLNIAGQVLRTLLGALGLPAIVLTEVNPTHDPTGALLDLYIDTVATAITDSQSR